MSPQPAAHGSPPFADSRESRAESARPVAPLVPVVDAAQSAARDAAEIAAGTPSRALMGRAGAAAAAEIALRYGDRLRRGALVLAGPGNNGGDAWVVARGLAAAGVRVRVIEPLGAKTDDARAERGLAVGSVELDPWTAEGGSPGTTYQGEGIVVDGLLGTGATGAPRGPVARAVEAVRGARARGAAVVALDLPTGLDATTGAAPGDAVEADLTLTFGGVKRGHLMARGRCGRIVVLDIGLGDAARLDDGAPALVDERWVAARVPPIAAEAHKGARRKLVVVGGAEGMSGACVLAARAAMRSGIGMVRLLVARASLPAVQALEPLALTGEWPSDDAAAEREIVGWADAVVIGPGLGRSAASGTVLERVLRAWRGPVLLDADALNLFDGDLPSMRALLAGRAALLTPHPVELARLARCQVEDVLARRFEIGREVADATGAAVLLKGVPTIVSDGAGRALVSASGTPALAAAGSGDILSGIAGTLLAQLGDPLVAGAAAAWVHGRAAERPGERDGGRLVRGLTLDDVLDSLGTSWALSAAPTRYPVLAELPPVGENGA